MPDQGDRTEPATPRRRSEARKRGQVARSVELSSAFILLFSVLFMRFFGAAFFDQIAAAMQLGLRFTLSHDLELATVLVLLPKSIFWFIHLLLPILLFTFVIALFVNFIQVGVVFSGQPIVPSLEKINPVRGFQRLFSLRSFVELAKSLVKVVTVGGIAYWSIRAEMDSLTLLSGFSPAQAGLKVASIAYVMGFRIALLFLALAIADYIYQRVEFERSIRMSKQEIKEEYKHLEGDPLIRQRIRQRQREIARRRMLHEVPRADVIITNPTHIAIAIRYDASTMRAPKVVAKGIRLLAEKILDLAAEHRIPIYQNPPLAQALYKACEIGDEVPQDLYGAVAEVLAFVYSASGKKPA